jgi:glycerophosphoryl diester phosphodiesterase
MKFLRAGNNKKAGQSKIMTLEDVLILVRSLEQSGKRRVGLYIELKRPAYFRSLGLSMEGKLLNVLKRYGYWRRDHPVFIQSFEIESLQRLRKKSSLRLIQLIWKKGIPADQRRRRNPWTYKKLISKTGLTFIRSYANGIGIEKSLLLKGAKVSLNPQQLIAEAHKRDLYVHVFTFRYENYFISKPFRSWYGVSSRQRFRNELNYYMQLGVDGLFTDNVMKAHEARNLFFSRP